MRGPHGRDSNPLHRLGPVQLTCLRVPTVHGWPRCYFPPPPQEWSPTLTAWFKGPTFRVLLLRFAVLLVRCSVPSRPVSAIIDIQQRIRAAARPAQAQRQNLLVLCAMTVDTDPQDIERQIIIAMMSMNLPIAVAFRAPIWFNYSLRGQGVIQRVPCLRLNSWLLVSPYVTPFSVITYPFCFASFALTVQPTTTN